MNEPLLLLPGMMCDERLFGPQAAALSRDRDVLHGDITGAATWRHWPSRCWTRRRIAFALAGLSMGGIVAMEVMRQAPGRVTRLALLDTNPRAELPEVKARRVPQMAEVRAGGLERVMREELKPNYLTHGPAL
jgi:pimeloyl-ACP methyl ester carboxylesterase